MADKLISADKLAQNFQHKTWYSSDEVLDTISDAQGVDAESMYAVYERWSNHEEDYEDFCTETYLLIAATTKEKALDAVQKRRNDIIEFVRKENEEHGDKNRPPFFGIVPGRWPNLNVVDNLYVISYETYDRHNDYLWILKEIEPDTILLPSNLMYGNLMYELERRGMAK